MSGLSCVWCARSQPNRPARVTIDARVADVAQEHSKRTFRAAPRMTTIEGGKPCVARLRGPEPEPCAAPQRRLFC
jgi:hypothetical protein